MLRILQVVPYMGSGGLETLIMNLYRNIDRSQVQFDFLTHYKRRSFYDDEIESLGGHIYRLSVREDNNYLKYFSDLDAFFGEHSSDYKIVHGHMASFARFYLKVAKKHGIPVRIVHSHNANTATDVKGRMKNVLLKGAPKYANVYFACGEAAGKFLYGDKKFYILNNGIEMDKFRYDENKRKKVRNELGLEGKLVIGNVSRFNIQKNHTKLIDIFKELHSMNPNSALLLVGTGELEGDIQNKVKNLGLNDSVRFLGLRKDVNELYQAMDVFVMPSLFEGFPVTATECQTEGLPFLTSTNVSSEVNVLQGSGLVEFLPLSENNETWAMKAIDMGSKTRTDHSEEMTKAGYNIAVEAKWLQNYYMEMYRKYA